MQVLDGAVLVVGQRADITVQDRVLYRPESVQKKVSALQGRLHPAYGVDYFAIARNLYPWNLVPDLVIGRPAYDNFMVHVASTHNMSVVDATQTLTALHQTDKDGVGSGHRRSDSQYNRKTLSRFQSQRGCGATSCTAYKTRWHTEPVSMSRLIVKQKRRRVVVERRKIKK